MDGRTVSALFAVGALLLAAAPSAGAAGGTTAVPAPAPGGAPAASGLPVGPTHPFRPGPVPTPKALQVEGQYYSANWSGFIDGATPDATSPSGLGGTGATFDGVSADWTVPQLAKSAPNSYEASWIGLGGVAGTQNLLQAGTIEYFSGPRAKYVAFVEDYPDPPLYFQAAVKPGDAFAASVTAPETVSVSDLTQGWTSGPIDVATTYAGYGYTYYAPDQQTAEWIVEDPTCGGSLCAFANFSPETWSPVVDTAAATPAGPVALSPLEAIIVNAQAQPQVTVTPASIGSSSTSTSAPVTSTYAPFTVSRGSASGGTTGGGGGSGSKGGHRGGPAAGAGRP